MLPSATHPGATTGWLKQASSGWCPDMEEAETKWQEGQPLVALWMAASGVWLLSSLFWLPLGFIGGILGIAGASLMLCRCHRCFSFALAVKVRHFALHLLGMGFRLLLQIPQAITCVLQGTQVLASVCVVLSAFLAAVLSYNVVVIRCSTQRHSARYCFQLTSTCAVLWPSFWSLCWFAITSFGLCSRCIYCSCRLCILVVWHCLYAVLCVAVVAHSSNVKRLLDPVKSGVLLLPRRRIEQGQGASQQPEPPHIA